MIHSATLTSLTRVHHSNPDEGWVHPALMEVRRVVFCGRWVSINEQFVLRRYTHVKGDRGMDQRGEGELFPHTTSPLPTLGAAPPAHTAHPMSSQWVPANLGNQPIGRCFQGGPTGERGSTHLGIGKHRPKRCPGSYLSNCLTAIHTKPRSREKSRGKPPLPRFTLAFLNNVWGLL